MNVLIHDLFFHNQLSQEAEMSLLLQKIANSKQALVETYGTIRWIWQDLLGVLGRKKSGNSVLLLMLTTLILHSGTYLTKAIVDALTVGHTDIVLWLLLGIGVVHFTSRSCMAWHARERELAWNDNHFHIRTRLNAFYFDRTMGELITEESDIGPEQIEAAQNKIDNLMHLILFSVSPALVTVVSGVVVIATLDLIAALIMSLMLGFNVLWFLYYNDTIALKITPVDKAFRRVSNRMGEYWTQFQSTKTSGVEDRVCQHIESDLREVLAADKAIWADWFIPLDVKRGVVNITSFFLFMLYGTYYAKWGPGDFTAMTIWTAMIGEKFSVIGGLMRHLTEYTTRIKAIRDTLTKPPAFCRHTGEVYSPGGSHAHET